jgi:hypothetical protein
MAASPWFWEETKPKRETYETPFGTIEKQTDYVWGNKDLSYEDYNAGRFSPSQFSKYAQAGKFGISGSARPDTTAAAQSGKVVDVMAEDLPRALYVVGKNTEQALFIHPQTKQLVTLSELPKGPSGRLQAIGQADGNPFVSRAGNLELLRMPEQSQWVKMRDRFINPIALPMAGLALGAAALPGLSAGAAGAAGTAGATGAGAAGAGAALPELGAGLFAGGAETAGATSGGFLGGGGGFLGFGSGASGASALPGFATPTLGATQMASTGGGLSGLMSWLGSPTGQAAMQAGSAALQSGAAQRAGAQQAGAAQAGIEEQRRQFEAMRAGLAPFQQAGTQALGGFAPFQQAGLQAFQQQQALAGLQGQPAQQQAISALEQSPLYQSLAKQGEEALLQRASATGGLRGGNIQAALAQFRPAMLQQLIDQQYARLGGLSGTGLGVTAQLAGMGQSSAAMQGQGGMGMASNIGNLLAQQGQAQAGGTLGTAQGIGQLFNIPSQIAGQQRANALFDMMSRMPGVTQ